LRLSTQYFDGSLVLLDALVILRRWIADAAEVAVVFEIGKLHAPADRVRTGARNEMSAEAEKLVGRMRQFSDLPVAVGFGISKPEHVADVWRYADAAVVGSAIVAQIEKAESAGNVVSTVGRFVRELTSI